jgi:hypothetical protein
MVRTEGGTRAKDLRHKTLDKRRVFNEVKLFVEKRRKTGDRIRKTEGESRKLKINPSQEGRIPSNGTGSSNSKLRNRYAIAFSDSECAK